MRLLFDENLSPRLPALLVDEYPESVHVRDVGLASAGDDEVWTYAANNRFTIVSKDSDFHQRSTSRASQSPVRRWNSSWS